MKITTSTNGNHSAAHAERGHEAATADHTSTAAEPRTETRRKRSYRVTPQALHARRTNAKKSTGPRSVAGKDKSRRNALRHGMTAMNASILVDGEDVNAFDAMYDALRRRFPPVDILGEYFVKQLANEMWRQSRRINLAETALIQDEANRLTAAESIFSEPLPGGHGHYLDTVSGITELREAVEETFAKTPEDTATMNTEAWTVLRDNAKLLAEMLPQLKKFVTAAPTGLTLLDYRQTLAANVFWLRHREAQLRSRRIADLGTALVPDGPKMERIMRYSAMSERKIRMLMKFIEKYCAQGREMSDGADGLVHRIA